MKKYSFPGGIHPPYNKGISATADLGDLVLPDTVFVPLSQHIGAPNEPLVKKGDLVKKIDGSNIKTISQLIQSLGGKEVRSNISTKIDRNNEILNYNLTLREKKQYHIIRKVLQKLMTIYGIEIDENSITGEIIVSHLSPQSMSYGIKKGDVLFSYNGEKVSSLNQFIKFFNKNRNKISNIIVIRDSEFYKIDFTKKD